MNGSEASQADYQDKTLVCQDCGEEFTWEKGEQAFFANLGYPPPRRCLECRKELRRKRHEAERRAREAQNGH